MTGAAFAALVAARWIHFASVMLIFGASLFPFYALPARAADFRAPACVRGAMRLAALIAAISGLAWAAASLVNITGDAASVFDTHALAAFLFETGFGKIWTLRFLLLLAMLLTLFLAGRDLQAHNLATALLAFVAAVLLVSQAWIGHPAASVSSQRSLVIAGYALHVLGAGAWLGGLPPLLLILGAQNPNDRIQQFALRRFSALGMLAIGMILTGGITNAWARWNSFDALIASAWGKVLLAKVLGFAVLVALAAINRFVLMPRLATSPMARARLIRNVVAEQAGGVAILAAAAVLGIVPPPA